MHMYRLLMSLVISVLVAVGVWYSGLDPATGVAAAASPQQGNQTRNTNLVATLDDLKRRTNRCAVRDPLGDEQVEMERQADAGGGRNDGSIATIQVYWHVITTASGGGNISGLVPAQMQVLSDAYAGSGFAFNVASVQVIANNTWFFAELGSAEEAQMKATLRRGGPDALNIYTTNGDVYLGWATLPFYYKFFPSYDGVVLWWASMPGTGLAGPADEEPDGVLTYDEGDTGTHEVGHWLGLNHTFAGGCSHPGDSIKDTPAEAAPQFFCVARDSCTGPPFRGSDAITNFMNYVDDVCMDRFTSDLSKRMRKHWHAFRDKKFRE
jgi:hypothetical protein